MTPTEAELNLLTFLRTCQPFDAVTISFDRNGLPLYRLHTQREYVIDETGIKSLAVGNKKLSPLSP